MNIISFIVASLLASYLITDILFSNGCKLGTIKIATGIITVLIAFYVYEISLELYNILLLVFASNLEVEIWITRIVKKFKGVSHDKV